MRRILKDNATIWSLLFLLCSAATAYAAWQFRTSWQSNLWLGASSAFFSVAIAVFVASVFLDYSARKKASGPLLLLVNTPIKKFHDDFFIQAGWDEFGKAEFGRHIDVFQENGRNCDAWSPEVRQRMVDLVERQEAEMVETLEQIDARLTDLINVLGWSFDPNIIGAAIQAKLNIAEFYSITPPKDDGDKRKRVELFFNIDASSNASVHMLYETIGGKRR